MVYGLLCMHYMEFIVIVIILWVYKEMGYLCTTFTLFTTSDNYVLAGKLLGIVLLLRLYHGSSNYYSIYNSNTISVVS